MANENPFGPMPIDNYEPAKIAEKLAGKIATLSDAECDEILAKLEADIQAKRQMAGVRAALESVVGLVGRILL
jgi:hypothetical protein